MVSLKAIKESDWINSNLGDVAQDVKDTGRAIYQFPIRKAFTTVGVIAFIVLGFYLVKKFGSIKSNLS